MQDFNVPVLTPENIDEMSYLLIQDSSEAYNDMPKHAGGRPTVITKDVLRKLRQGFMMGFNDREASAYAGIGEQTLYDLQKRHPEFSEEKAAWKLNPILKAKYAVYIRLDDFNNAKWYLERRARDEFSPTYQAKDPDYIERIANEIDREFENHNDVAEKIREEERLRDQKLTENIKNGTV